jgi:Zn-dependent peptidase ImmA (M78 family)
MRWADAHREGMAAAADALEELDVDEFERVDVFEAIARAGLKLMFRKLDCAALYLPAREGARAGAIVNANHPVALQRFSAGHEYGHHIFGHGGRVDLATEPRASARRLLPDEKLAEAFAAWFLMPPEAAETALGRLGLSRAETPQHAYGLALRLGTSFRATCIHLPTLKLGPATARDWGDRELKSLKQELTAISPKGGWRNDVWVLRKADAQAPLVVRAGDRLRIDLPGTRLAALPAGATSAGEASSDLLGASSVTVDLSPETPAGPASVELEVDGAPLVYDLVIERPRLGRFVPAARVGP